MCCTYLVKVVCVRKVVKDWKTKICKEANLAALASV